MLRALDVPRVGGGPSPWCGGSHPQFHTDLRRCFLFCFRLKNKIMQVKRCLSVVDTGCDLVLVTDVRTKVNADHCVINAWIILRFPSAGNVTPASNVKNSFTFTRSRRASGILVGWKRLCQKGWVCKKFISALKQFKLKSDQFCDQWKKMFQLWPVTF